MQRTTVLTGLTLTVFFLLSSCSFETPTEVVLRGQPAFDIPAGNRTTEISEVWDVEAALEEAVAGTDSGLSRVDTADGDPLAIALNRSLIDISVDEFAGDGLSLDDLNQTINVSYTIPEIGFAGESFSSNIEPIEVPAGVSIPSVALGSIPEVNGTASVPAETIEATGYGSITFDAGTLRATPSVTDTDSSVTGLSISGARILTTTGDVIASASNVPVDALGSGALEFALDGATLPSSFDVELNLSMATTAPVTSSVAINLAFGFSADTRISGASGIDFAQTVTGEYTIPLGEDLDFQDATVGEGTLEVNPGFPAEWSGIQISIDPITLSQGGATKAGPSSTPIDLAGVTLTNEDILVAYTVTVDGTDAAFSLDPDADEVTGTIGGSIVQFSEVNVLESTFDTVESFSTDIDQETRDLVDWVLFTNPVFELTLNNQLGTGVEVNITSTTVSGGNPVTFANAADTTTSVATFADGSENTARWNIAPNLPGSEFAIDMPSLDVEVAVSFVDATPNDGTATLTNVTPGAPLSLTGEVAAIFEVDAIQIASETISGQFPEVGSEGIDFSQISDFLPDGVEFDGISSQLVVDTGSNAGGIDLRLVANYTDADGVARSEGLMLVDGAVDGATVTEATFSSGSTIDLNLQSLINSGPSDLFFEYTVTVTGITIEDPGQRIAADLTGEIPLSFEVVGEDDLELLDENGDPIVPPQEEDLFGRSADESAEIDDIIDSLAAIRFHVDIENNIGFNGKLVIEDTNSNGDLFREEITLESGAQTIEIDGSDLDIIKEFPFIPTTTVYMTPGTHSVNTGGDLSIALWFEIDTDLDLSFSLTGEDE